MPRPCPQPCPWTSNVASDGKGCAEALADGARAASDAATIATTTTNVKRRNVWISPHSIGGDVADAVPTCHFDSPDRALEATRARIASRFATMIDTFNISDESQGCDSLEQGL